MYLILFIIFLIIELLLFCLYIEKGWDKQSEERSKFIKSLSDEDIECFLRHPNTFPLHEYRLLEIEQALRKIGQ